MFQDSWRGGGTGIGSYLLQPKSAAAVPLTLQGLSGQSANLIELKNSVGVVVFSVTNAGVVTSSSSGSGTVTSVSVSASSGIVASVSNATTTPAITLSLGAITPTSVNGITISGTSGTTMTFPSTSATLARTDSANTFTGASTASSWVLTSPTLITPSAFTTGGTITLAENTSIALDPAGSADGKYTGITIAGTAGATLAFGDLVYLDPTDSRWELADANSAAAADGDARGVLGICVLAAASDGSATTILLYGTVRADAVFPALTIGAPAYVSETAGDIVVAQPVTTDAVIRVVGSALTADELLFNPSPDYITHT